MNKLLIAATLGLGLLTSNLAAAEAFVWGNAYGDATLQKGLKGNPLEEVASENITVGAEGGIITENVNTFGFAEYNAHLDSMFVKGTAHIDFKSDVSVYVQLSHFGDKVFSEGRALAGVGYTGLANDKGSFSPFIGWNISDNTYASDNFMMMGWSANYKVTKNIMVINWHETEVNKGLTANGAVGINYETNWILKDSYVGASYRYMYNAAGVQGFGDAVMLRIGVHL